MKRTLLTTTLVLLAGLGFTLNASAQDWTCSDLTWSAERLEATPDISSYCLDVVEKSGLPYAKLHARIERQGVNSTFVVYQSPDGKWSRSQKVDARGMTAEIGGKDVKIGDLPPRQEVNVYVKSENNFSYSAAPAVAAAASTPVAAPAPAEEPAPMVLPTTATQLSLFALLGGLLILMGGVVAVVRTRL